MKTNKIQLSFSVLFLLLCFSSCKKYLEAKSDNRLSTPSNLDDLQMIMDYVAENNIGTKFSNIATDEYYITTTVYNGLTVQEEKNGHTWQAQTDALVDWSAQYKIVFRANTILDNLKVIQNTGQEQKWNYIKGSALFLRAHSFYLLAQLFAKQYNQATSSEDLGIPLRLTSDFNGPSVRSTVLQTYEQMIGDLTESLTLLPENPLYKTRPGKAAAFGLLSRIYLTMGDYANAKQNADKCLHLYNTLLDYNLFSPSDVNPLKRFNDEILFYANTFSPTPLYNFNAKIDSNLYSTYDSVDLRKTVFFKVNSDGTYAYKTSYNEAWFNFFSGIGTDEIYLIRAECNARMNDKEAALQDLNTLLIKRYAAVSFVPVTTLSLQETLSRILLERKKELIFRGLRWSDIRRLNRDGANITVQRVLNNQTIALLPNDLRTTFLIPVQAVRLSGMQQNDR